MRVTNQMMINSMLSSINKNKINMSKLEEQYSSGKKIQKPSDDPIVAVRALKLRTTLSEIDQYLDKNIPDAQNWMETTESALDNVNDILQQMNTYCIQAAQDSMTLDDRNSILQNLVQLAEQVYSEGNTQYAGRYVFSGYKTDTSLTYTSDTSDTRYSITETFSGSDVELKTTVVSATFNDDGSLNTAATTNETHRIQLSYQDCDSVEDTELSSITYTNSDGETVTFPSTAEGSTESMTTMSSTDDGAYTPGDDEIIYLADTGELILGANIAESLSEGSNISFTYEKTNFESGDLRPELYYSCTATTIKSDGTDGTTIAYEPEDQSISYEVSFSQSIQVNTQGRDAITSAIARMIDDMETAISNVQAVEDKISAIETKLEDSSLSDSEISTLEAQKEALETELTLNESILQDTFSTGITTTSDQQSVVNVATSDLGSRINRLDLIESRLEDQQVQFEELKSTNEDVDLVEVIIQYNSADAIYTASLSAAAKVVKNTLLDFL